MKVCSFCRWCYDDAHTQCSEEGHPLLEESRDLDTDAVEGYRLEVLLESDRSSDIYRAHQMASGHTCLIKILPADKTHGEEFLRAARDAAAFFHPNVVDVYEAGSLESGELYVISEEAEGPTLRELLHTAGAPQLLSTIVIARQAAEALHALHLKGLTHGAVNPGNIILANDPEQGMLVRVKDIDFGGALAHSIISDKFQIDSALDSLRYFAPEVCNGEAAGMKADIYSLGVVLYEMLAGAPPFDATKASGLIEMHRNQPPPDIRINNFDLRMLLTHTLTESLQKQSRLRQSSANAFARQMRHIEQLATHVSTPPPAGAVRSTAASPSLTASAVPATAKPIVVNPGRAVMTQQPIAESAPVDMQAAEIDLPLVEPVIEETTVEKPVGVAEPAPAKISYRSRLKMLRKRFQQSGEPLTITAIKSEAPIAETEPVLAAPAGIVSIQTEPEKIEMAATAASTVVSNKIEPVKLEWATPDDDIPSMDAVAAALSESGEAATGLLPDLATIDDQPSTIEPSVSSPHVSKGSILVSSTATVPEPTINNQPSSPVPAPLPRRKRKSKPAPERIVPTTSEAVQLPLVISAPSGSESTAAFVATNDQRSTINPQLSTIDPEEITVVTALRESKNNRGIRIHLRDPKSRLMRAPMRQVVPVASGESPFSPNLLGAASRKRESGDIERGDSFLSIYNASLANSSTIIRRSVTIGGGLLVLVSVLLFGGKLLKLDVLADKDGETVAASTAPKALPQPDPAASAKKPAVKNLKQPAPVDTTPGATVDRSNPLPATKNNSSSSEKSKDADVKSTPGKESKVTARNASSAPPAKSSNGGKTKPTAAPEKKSVNKQSTSSSNKPTGSTRPRIVANPRP